MRKERKVTSTWFDWLNIIIIITTMIIKCSFLQHHFKYVLCSCLSPPLLHTVNSLWMRATLSLLPLLPLCVSIHIIYHIFPSSYNIHLYRHTYIHTYIHTYNHSSLPKQRHLNSNWTPNTYTPTPSFLPDTQAKRESVCDCVWLGPTYHHHHHHQPTYLPLCRGEIGQIDWKNDDDDDDFLQAPGSLILVYVGMYAYRRAVIRRRRTQALPKCHHLLLEWE